MNPPNMNHADPTTVLGFKKRQLKLVAGGVAILVAAGFLAPLTASANVSASLIESVPNRLVQEFPLRDGAVKAKLTAPADTGDKHTLAKQAPKKSYEVVQNLGSQVTTAYTSAVAECDGNPFVTASGSRTHFGTVANNRLAFGTLVKIEGFGDQIFRVEDRGGSAFDFDIWMPTKARAYAHGRRTLQAWIVKLVKA